ncbi:MAG: BREX-2 system phosphatase PglZ [Planctomycetota bacterium]
MTLTEPVLRAKLATIQKRLAEDGSSKRCIGVLGEGWVGPEQVRVGDEVFRVVFCGSPLAVREQMDSLVGNGPRLVVVTNCPEQALGADVQARVFRNRFQPVDPWQTVRELFQATRLGPGVPQEAWLRDELVASTVEQRPSLAAGTVLDLATVKQVISRRLGLSGGAVALRDLLAWALQPEAAGFVDRDERMQAQIRTWVEDSAGKAGGAIVDCVASGYGVQALALGLVFRLIVGEGTVQDASQREALARAERFVGHRRLSIAELGPWADAAEDLFRQWLAPDQIKVRQPVLAAADEMAESLGVAGLAHESRFLQEGLRQREQRFAVELEQALASGTADLAGVERAAGLVARHELAILERGRAIPAAVTMAVRLLRWLRRGSGEKPAGFRAAALVYGRDGSFVDWAREQTTLGYPHAALQQALRSLWAAVQTRREQQNQHFAEMCAEWHKAPAASEDLIPLEEVLSHVVQPIAERVPVLFLVMDGMSLSVFHEIANGLPRLGWLEIGPAEVEERGMRRYGVAVLPTVTEVSRASLLAGEVCRGNQESERAAFESSQALQIGGSKPQLFHKGTLSGDRLGVEPEVERVLRDKHRVVGVVLNAVDDWLGKGSEDAAPWDVERIKSLVALLDLAAQTGRVVVITSDHGHVRDHDTRFVGPADGTRWRRSGKPAAEGEVLMRGPRVCLANDEREVVLPWTETVRYSSTRQNGYHGGASPQEVLVPLAVFSHASRDIPLPDYAEVPPGLPSWWDEPATAELPQPRRTVPARGKAKKGPTLPFADSQDDNFVELLASELFQEQKKLHLRGYPGDDKLQLVLRALAERGDSMTLDALASRLELAKFRVQGLLTAMRRVLNVDGTEGLEVDMQSGTVRVNWSTLKTQFGLQGPRT